MRLFGAHPVTAALVAICTFVAQAAAQIDSPNEAAPSPALEEQRREQEHRSVASLPPSLPEFLASQAEGYTRFYSDISDIDRQSLRTPNQIQAAIDRLISHDPIRLAEGWIAYAADIALNTPSFYGAFNERKILQGRTRLLSEISTKPGFVYALPESTAAAQLITNMIAVETDVMASLGRAFLIEAKQRKRFGRANRWPEAQTDNNSQPPWLPVMTKKDAAASTLLLPTVDSSQNMPPVMKRVLDLAGRIAIDAIDGPEQDATKSLMSNSRMARCLKWADLNMKQCTAAAKESSELAYCAGTHALNERANYWSTLVTVSNGT